jgi:S1-C subfamily serine protease
LPRERGSRFVTLLLLFCLSFSNLLLAKNLPDTISQVKPSIVAVGTFQKTRNPQYVFKGTGFIAGNGKQVITNSHLIPSKLDHQNREMLAVFSGEGKRFKVLPADLIKRDKDHDLALLEIQSLLPALNLGTDRKLGDGSDIAITGFPLGMVLGLYPVTHKGIIAASVPLAIPPAQQKNLTTDMIRALRNPFRVYQLDITAYPGNSGSPVYNPVSGEVIAVINSGYVKGKKETALSTPSGITYAIPVKFVKQLLAQ